MKVENNGKVQVLDHLVKSATTKSTKQTAVGQKEGQQQTVDTVELSERASTLEKLKGKAKASENPNMPTIGFKICPPAD